MSYSIKLQSKISAISVCTVGVIVITGWFLNIAVFKSILPGFISMKFNTALCFLFSGISLWIVNKEKNSILLKSIFFICTSTVLILGTLSELQFLFHVNLGIDELFIKDDIKATETVFPGRMAPGTSISFALIAANLFMIYFNYIKYKLAHIISLSLLSLSTFAFSGYLFGVGLFYGILFNITKMAIHTSFSFIILAIGLLTAQGNRGVLILFTNNTVIGKAVRRFLVVIIIIELCLGWLHLLGEKYNIYGASFGIALTTLANIFVLTIIILFGAKRLIIEDGKRKKAELKLEEHALLLKSKNTQLNDFCNIVCHNLRGPLVNISMLVDFIEAAGDDEERKEMLEKLKPVANHLNEVFNELIESVQVRNDLDIKSENIALEDYIKTNLEGMEMEIFKYGATFEIDIKAASTINYPPKYLDSILANLISNALKYKSPYRNPIIKIKTERNEDSIILSVCDNGLGIDMKKYKDQLFKIRKVFHNHPNAKGFGLFMTKTQVEAMGGNIWAESQPDEGTTFYVEFKNQNV